MGTKIVNKIFVNKLAFPTTIFLYSSPQNTKAEKLVVQLGVPSRPWAAI